MIAPDLLHLVRVAIHDRLHDALVLLVAESPEVRLAQHAGAEVPNAPVPQPIGHARQKAAARPVDDHAVKLGVPLMPGLGIVPGRRLLHRSEELAQSLDVGARQARHGQASGQGLQTAAHLGDLADGVG